MDVLLDMNSINLKPTWVAGFYGFNNLDDCTRLFFLFVPVLFGLTFWKPKTVFFKAK